jgi:hypothetical protein
VVSGLSLTCWGWSSWPSINERLKTPIVAYKTLGGSFSGNLAVDSHLRDVRMRATPVPENPRSEAMLEWVSSERSRRTRDTVEAALSDVILLGTSEQVRMAAQAANDMVAGRKIETAALVRSLRDFIRAVLDLEAVPADLQIPKQVRCARHRRTVAAMRRTQVAVPVALASRAGARYADVCVRYFDAPPLRVDRRVTRQTGRLPQPARTAQSRPESEHECRQEHRHGQHVGA